MYRHSNTAAAWLIFAVLAGMILLAVGLSVERLTR